MPQSAGQEHHHGVSHGPPLAAPAAAKRYVEVIHEPGVERNVPTAPELRYVARKVREMEIPHQLDPEEARRPYRNVGIAGKVAVNLERKQQRPNPEIQRPHSLIVGKDQVDHRCGIVGNHHLLEQPPQYQSHTVNAAPVAKTPVLHELRYQVGGALYRPRHKLREETDEDEERQRFAYRLHLAAVNVYHIAQCLESIKGNSDGEDKVERHRVGLHSGQPEQPREAAGKEIEIFENAQSAQTQHGHYGHRPTPHGAASVIAEHNECAGVANRRYAENQKQEAVVPPTVKHIAGRQEQPIATPKRLERQPVEQEHNRQEQQEFYRVKKHILSASKKFFQCKLLLKNLQPFMLQRFRK